LLPGTSNNLLSVVPQHASIDRPEQLVTLWRRYLDDQNSVGIQDTPASLLLPLMLWEVASSSGTNQGSAPMASDLAALADALIQERIG
jgi:hypothetical protein